MTERGYTVAMGILALAVVLWLGALGSLVYVLLWSLGWVA